MPKESPIHDLNQDLNSNINHINTNNTNLLAHAKKKAKKLYHLSKEKNFIIEINSLSEAQQIIAKINGYDNWHILEQVSQNKQQHEEKQLLESKNNHFINKFKKHNNFILEDKEHNSIPYIIEENKNEISSFLQLDYLSYQHYHDILGLLQYCQKQLKLILDREFSVIELDVFHLEDTKKTEDKIIYDPIDQKVNDLILNQAIFDALKIHDFEEPSISNNNYNLSVIVTIKTSLFAKNEHFLLINTLTDAIADVKYSFISKHDVFKKYFHLEQEKHQYALNVMEEADIKENTIFSANLKFLHNLSDKNINWSWHINKQVSHLIIYSKNIHEQQTFSYLINGYKKEIIKNSHSDLSSSISNEAFNFKILSPQNDDNTMIIPANQRSTYNDLILGLPGSGKSIFSQTLILKNILEYTKKNDHLPYLGIIDIGSSYDGLLEILKTLVINEEKKLIQKYTLEMNSQYCVNVFDTPLGCRFPSSEQKTFLGNFILTLLIDPETHEIPQGISGFIFNVIDELYKTFSDYEKPKLYDKNVLSQVDEVLTQTSLQIDKKTTWWDVVDALFKANKYHEATLAQRHAVPLLSDLIISIQQEKNYLVYEKIITNTGENIIEFCIRKISDSINLYPILARPTVFSVDHHKLVYLDLDKVAKSGGPMAQQQTAIMYMVSYFLLCKSFYSFFNAKIDITDLNFSLSEEYQNYYEKLIKQKQTITQFVYLDELHRVFHKPTVQEQIIIAMREGRKSERHLTLLSQDYSILQNKQLVSFTTSFYILDASSLSYKMKSDLETLAPRISLSNNKKFKNAIYHLCYTQKGKVEHFIYNKISSALLWSVNTQISASILREKLIKDFGFIQSIDILIKHYPAGYLPYNEHDVNQIYQKLYSIHKK